ncbi:hypothetical protein [Rickettsia endosymbiont of Rhinocyllus conicus]|uniref:hypothetical protein n=1 Tax=Rickettsia endosymbiont of Rhinocyllus conicus TaxID=3066252 RepID=UPI0031330E0C
MVLAYQEKALMIKNDMDLLTHQFQNGNLTQQQYDDKMANPDIAWDIGDKILVRQYNTGISLV